MASSALSPVARVKSDEGGNTSAHSASPDGYPVPPEWILTDPADNKRRILALLEQGERDIAANRGRAADEVFREADELIAAAAAQPSRRS